MINQKFITASASLFFLILFCARTTFAQDDYLHCGTSEIMNRILDSNPKLKQEYLQEQERLEQIDHQAFLNGYKEGNERALLPIYIIPIVFHILHENGTENISDAQIVDEVRILNEDFRKLNADITSVVSAFQPVAADCEIEFRLAQKAPNGTCTNGIDRIYSSLTNNADDNSKLNDWPNNRYLNVWVVKSIGSAGVAGYAYYPGATAPTNDGVLILSHYIGSIGSGNPTRARALTHEIGHYLNLKHVWGSSNSAGVDCSGTDGVSDTPVTKGYTTCNLSGTSQLCTAGVAENVQNYMEYSYCSKMFTLGQKTRMRNTLNSSSGNRNNLWTSANLNLTGISTPATLCQADFKNNTNNNIVCSGDSVLFTDLSWNGTPTGWNWTFPGGNPSVSYNPAPQIKYNTPGIYNVSLTTSNATGSVSATKNAYITVNPSQAMYNNSVYSEGFENNAIPNTDWIVRNQNTGSSTWQQTGTAAASGTKSVCILNSTSFVGHIDELISPSVNMAGITGTNPTLTFKVAHAQLSSASIDKLQVYVSTNCGKNWQLRKAIQGAALSTAGVVGTSFIPNSAQWTQQSINLSTYAGQPDLFFMFRFISDGGNNIYIDNIMLSGNAVGIEEEFSNKINFNLFPNPTDQNPVINFILPDKQKVSIKVHDIIGREVSGVFEGELNEGEHHFTVPEKISLKPGVYFVKLTVSTYSCTKKMIVK